MKKSLLVASILSLFAATSFAQAAVDPIQKAPTVSSGKKPAKAEGHHKHHHGKKHHGKAAAPATGASEAK